MNDNALVPYSDIQKMAADVVASRLFQGITTTEAAMTLMLLCQSEGLHPMQALTRYHIISGRPAMKADAMLAEFMRRGGTVDWIEWTNEVCEAKFTSQGCPEGVNVRWTMEDAARAGLGRNPTWKSYPRQMLKARVASDGVRMTDPAVNQGRYTPEEVSEFEPVPKVTPAEIVPPEAQEENLTPVLEASIAAEEAKRGYPLQTRGMKGAGRSSREASGFSEPVAPKAPDADAPQPAPASIFGDGRIDDPEDEPERCPECDGEVHTYKSRKGPDLRSCSFGRALWLENFEKTKNKEAANRAAAGHFYEMRP